MKAIDIEDDLYFYLQGVRDSIGGTYTEIIRRGLPNANQAKPEHRNSAPSLRNPADAKLLSYLEDPSFRAQRTAVGKFLSILSFLYMENPDRFTQVLSLVGRTRKYFGSEHELEASGRSVYPKQIPGTTFWVVTNNDTRMKRQMLEDVLRLLGYADATIKQVLTSLV